MQTSEQLEGGFNMKRTLVINIIISAILGGASGSFMQLAVSMSNTYLGVLAIGSAIGCILNMLCGPDKEKKEKDKE